MAWAINTRTGVAGHVVVRRVQGVLRRRLALRGLDLDDPRSTLASTPSSVRGCATALHRREVQRTDIEIVLDAIERIPNDTEETGHEQPGDHPDRRDRASSARQRPRRRRRDGRAPHDRPRCDPRGWPCALRGCSGVGKTLAARSLGVGARPRLPSPAVHSGHAPRGCHRLLRLRAGHRRLRVPARADLHRAAPRRTR